MKCDYILSLAEVSRHVPRKIYTNGLWTVVLTESGDIYLSEAGRRECFRDILCYNSKVGKVIQVQMSCDKIWMLNQAGSVFFYDLQNCIVRVYSQMIGGRAIKIAAGRDHLLILTNCNRIYGIGDNSQYQLVPQGNLVYHCPVELCISQTNIFTQNTCDYLFQGIYYPFSRPAISFHDRIICSEIKEGFFCYLASSMVCMIENVQQSGTWYLPLDISYEWKWEGFIHDDKFRGKLKFKILEIQYSKNPAGKTESIFVNEEGKIIKFHVVTQSLNLANYLSGNREIEMDCKLPVIDNTFQMEILCQLINPTGAINLEINFIGRENRDNLILCIFSRPEEDTLQIFYCKDENTKENIEFPLPITEIGHPVWAGKDLEISDTVDIPFSLIYREKEEKCLQQPCWRDIYAGDDLSILVDIYRKIYVFGSLYQIRINPSCSKNQNMQSKGQLYQTSLFIDISGGKKNDITYSPLHNLTIYNRKSVCRKISRHENCQKNLVYKIDHNSVFQFDEDHYFINGIKISSLEIIVLQYHSGSDNVNLYVDIDNPGMIRFLPYTSTEQVVVFPLANNYEKTLFSLNYGPILQTPSFVNYRTILRESSSNSEDCSCYGFPEPERNDCILLMAYLQKGDCVRFLHLPEKIPGITFPVTADLPTVIQLPDKILEIAIAHDYFLILLNSQRDKQIIVLGQNENGQLGIDGDISTIGFRYIPKNIFRCSIERVITKCCITFFILANYQIYYSGFYLSLRHSALPVLLKFDREYQIISIAISENVLYFLEKGGNLFYWDIACGIATDGELKLCQLNFFSQYTVSYENNLCYSQRHPILRKISAPPPVPTEPEDKCEKCFQTKCICSRKIVKKKYSPNFCCLPQKT